MDYSSVMALLNSFGFPVVFCGAMAWYVKYTTDKHREELAEVNNIHKEEMSQVTEALNNNTLAVQRLCDMLDK